MLHKRIDNGSIPFGLAIAGEDLVKGSAVVVKRTGNGANGLEAFYPTTQAEADSVKGFATFRIESIEGNDKDFDVIKKGSWVVIYTLVKDNMWGTTQFVSGVVAGDNVAVGFGDTDKGKIRKLTAGEVTASRKALAQVDYVYSAGEGYTDPMVDVTILV